MKPLKKNTAAYDKRQREYQMSKEDKSGRDGKGQQRWDSGGYKRPGSHNPGKVRTG